VTRKKRDTFPTPSLEEREKEGKKEEKKKTREEREKEPRHTEVALYPNE
jgi:hypothetical protein